MYLLSSTIVVCYIAQYVNTAAQHCDNNGFLCEDCDLCWPDCARIGLIGCCGSIVTPNNYKMCWNDNLSNYNCLESTESYPLVECSGGECRATDKLCECYNYGQCNNGSYVCDIDTCTTFPKFDSSSSSNGISNVSVTLIAVGSVVGMFVPGFLIYLCAECCRRRKKRNLQDVTDHLDPQQECRGNINVVGIIHSVVI
eukprot:UN07695